MTRTLLCLVLVAGCGGPIVPRLPSDSSATETDRSTPAIEGPTAESPAEVSPPDPAQAPDDPPEVVFPGPFGSCPSPVVRDPNAVVDVAPLERPAPGASYVDPAFGTTVTRIGSLQDVNDFDVPIYSQLQPFNADGALVLTTTPSGFRVRRVEDLELVGDGLSLSQPRWHPTQPTTLVDFDASGGEVRVRATTMPSGNAQTLVTLTGIVSILGNPSFEELSRDGRWIAGAGIAPDDTGVIFTWDLTTGAPGARIGIEGLYKGTCTPDPQYGVIDPDWVAPSPGGKYLVVQWPTAGDERCTGLETFDMETGAFLGQASTGRQHGDLGMTTAGADVHVTFEFADDGVAVVARPLPGTPSGPSPGSTLLILDWGNADHISCQGPAGSCLVTTGPGQWTEDATPGWQPLENEVAIVTFDGEVHRLAHHRSTECGYWAQPRASWSRDGRYALFASDFGVNPCAVWDDGEADAYLVETAFPCE